MFKRDQIWARTLTRLDKSSSVLFSREQRLATDLSASEAARKSAYRSGDTSEVWLNRIKARWCGEVNHGDQ